MDNLYDVLVNAAGNLVGGMVVAILWFAVAESRNRRIQRNIDIAALNSALCSTWVVPDKTLMIARRLK